MAVVAVGLGESALDAEAFFTEIAATMRDGIPDQAALNALG